MDLRSLAGARPTGRGRTNTIASGYVSLEQPAPTTFNDTLYVIVPVHSPEIAIPFDYWPASHGATLPIAGNPVRVEYDQDGAPSVSSWDGPYS